MSVLTLKHVPAPSFVSVTATGIVLTGPTGDGFVHMTFYRDSQFVTEEYFNVEATPAVSGVVGERIVGISKPGTVETFREDVVRIAVPASKMRDAANALSEMADRLEDIAKLMTEKNGHASP